MGATGLLLVACIVFSVQSAGCANPESAEKAAVETKKDLADIIGSSHVAGKYHFTEKDFLNEGADLLLDMGSRVIKVWFIWPQSSYPFNSEWPKTNTPVELAKTPHFQELLSKPFTTIMLMLPPETRTEERPEQAKHEKKRVYELSKYLLETYKDTGKTFIIQNWEGDRMLTPPGSTEDPDDDVVQWMIKALNARQDGVEQARKEVGTNGVMVAHAAEVNLVAKAMEGKKTATNDVLPHTRCDLYSYSAYDTCLIGATQFKEALEYLKKKAPDSKLYGADNIYVGEFGAPENSHNQKDIVKWSTEVALEFGARYIVYWQTYCNEDSGTKEKIAKREAGKRTNKEMRGFWLVRPDGSKSPAYEYFAGLLKPVKTP